VIALITLMWKDLKSEIRDGKNEWRQELHKVKSEGERDRDILWQAMRDCKNDCCPARKVHND
ncbi:MAG: hypothetical protein KJ630_10390, partial [Proteobacteria bacterium]|nr:hypothetical protein [Pseudomonadota bacterium]